MAARATWKGFLKISLVNIPIKVFPATESSSTLSFNQLHGECQTRIQQKRWCPTCNKEVANTELVKGYEFEKGRYVVMTEDDIEQVRPTSTRVIDLVQFADDSAIDPMYVDRAYYLAPDGGVAADAFAVMWMAEADALCRSSIRDAVGVNPERVRPLRAGDYSFNQIGPTGLYMLLSNIPLEERKRRGYYAVGGCGGNTAWHTPDDLMPVADLEILRRDLAVYLTTIVRIVNAPLHPFDYTKSAEEMAAAIGQYQQAAAGHVDFGPILGELGRLRDDFRTWRSDAEAHIERAPADGQLRRRLNAVLRRVARHLVPLNYARGERFDHDPALKFGTVPRLEAALGLPTAPGEIKPFLKVGLVREANKVRAILRDARRELTLSLGRPQP